MENRNMRRSVNNFGILHLGGVWILLINWFPIVYDTTRAIICIVSGAFKRHYEYEHYISETKLMCK